MQKKICKWIERILNLDLVIAFVCMTVLVCLTFAGSIARYFFRSPIAWQEEVQTWMILWTIFCGSSYAFRKGAHVSIDVLTENFSDTWQKIISWFGYLVTMAALAFFFYYATRLNIQFYETNKVTTTLRIPSWKIYIISSIGSIWMAISVTYYMIKTQFFPDTDVEEKGGDAQ